MKKPTADLIETIASMMDQIKISEYSQDTKYSPKAHYNTNTVPANNKTPPLKGVY